MLESLAGGGMPSEFLLPLFVFKEATVLVTSGLSFDLQSMPYVRDYQSSNGLLEQFNSTDLATKLRCALAAASDDCAVTIHSFGSCSSARLSIYIRRRIPSGSPLSSLAGNPFYFSQ